MVVEELLEVKGRIDSSIMYLKWRVDSAKNGGELAP